MKILRAAFGFVDVFIGEGWSNWTRVRKIKTKNGSRVVYIKGNKLNHHQMNTLDKKI
jgi:hypothetical protein